MTSGWDRHVAAKRLEDIADALRDGPFRDGRIDLAYVHGIEAAAEAVRWETTTGRFLTELEAGIEAGIEAGL